MGASNSSFRVAKTRQIWLRKNTLGELQSKGFVCFYSTPLDSLWISPPRKSFGISPSKLDI